MNKLNFITYYDNHESTWVIKCKYVVNDVRCCLPNKLLKTKCYAENNYHYPCRIYLSDYEYNLLISNDKAWAIQNLQAKYPINKLIANIILNNNYVNTIIPNIPT